MNNVIVGNEKGFNSFLKGAFNIGYDLMEVKLNLENC